MKNVINIERYKSPCGDLILGSFNEKLCLCDWANEKHRKKIDIRLKKNLNADYQEQTTKTLINARKELDEYFSGERKIFDIPLLFIGTDFQQKVWNELLKIQYGNIISYGQLAKNIFIPKAVRAIANANGTNAISIFVPCHRVIGSDGSLTGYGGGLDVKRYLLQLENPSLLF